MSIEAHDPLSKTLTETEKLILENHEEFPLNLSLIRREQEKVLNKRNSKLKLAINNKTTFYNVITLEGVGIVTFEGKIYVPKSLRKRTIEWYHHFLNHP